MNLDGMKFESSGHIIEILQVMPGETPDVRVRLVAAPEEGAMAEVGMEWTISYRDLMSGWNPLG